MLLALYLIPAVLTTIYLIYDESRYYYPSYSLVSVSAYTIVGLLWPVFISVNIYLGIRYLIALER